MTTFAKLSFIASLALIAAMPAAANMAPPEPAADPAAAPADPAAAPANPAAAPTDPAAAPTGPAAEAPPAEPPAEVAAEAPPAEETTTAEAPAEGGMSGGLIAAIVGGIAVLGGAAYWVVSRK